MDAEEFFTILLLFLFFVGMPILIIRYFVRTSKKSKIDIERSGSYLDKSVKNSIDFTSSKIKKIKKMTEKSISKSYITNCNWMLLNDDNLNTFYTFLNNDELLLTTKGDVVKGNYELIIDNNSILITIYGKTQYYNIINIEDDFLFLNKLSTDNLMIFANQTKFKDVIKSEILKNARKKYDYQKDNYSLE